MRDARITIRIPNKLKESIEHVAERERRSVSDVIVLMLTNAVESWVIPGQLLRGDLAESIVNGKVSAGARARARTALAERIVDSNSSKKARR